MITLEFTCDQHGPFETREDSATAPDENACPVCGAASPWTPSSLHMGTRYAVAATRARSDEAPSPYYLDTEPLADGMPMHEFQAKRDKLWEEHRLDQIKKAIS